MDSTYDEEEFLEDLVSVNGEEMDLELARLAIASSRDLPTSNVDLGFPETR
jgi:hypothetical protein